MHIEVGLASQQVASSINRRFIPEEIDWILNKIIERNVTDSVRPAENLGDSDFMQFQIDADRVRTLIRHDVPLKVITQGQTQSAILPPDYAYLIEDNSLVARKCSTDLNMLKTPGKRYIAFLKFVESNKNNKPFYADLDLSINLSQVVSGADMPKMLTSPEQLFEAVAAVRTKLGSIVGSSVQAYWEQYGNINVSNTLILVSDTEFVASMAYDAVRVAATYTTQDVTYVRTSGVDKQVVNRLAKSDRIGKLKQSTFSKSKPFSPLSVLEDNTLKVYSDDTFIVTQLLISYIRKPRKVSLNLGHNCDLPEEIHQSICDQAVEYIKMTTLDPGYQSKLQDNKLRGN